MTIHFEIPKDIEERLRAAGIDLTQMAKEALLVDLYRQHKITHRQLGECSAWTASIPMCCSSATA